ncbi:DNA-binding transcriptional LysR family regulator [Streptomyces canus]
MNLSRLDLNLVLALRALLEERNVTRAGERIGLSQPAMSAALSRLRRHFDDELLSRTGNAYELTPLGVALRDRSATACDLLERVFSSQAEFDPAAESREFTLLASDYGAAVFGAALARTLHQEAPGIRLTFQHPAPSVVENTATVLSTVDGLLMPHGVIDGFPFVDVHQDRWLCMVADDNPEVGDEVTLDHLANLPWAVYQRPYDAPVARQLSMIGISPRVEVSVQTFQLLPHMVEGTPPGHDDPGAPGPPHGPLRRGTRPALPLRGGTGARGTVVAPGPHPGRGPHLAAPQGSRGRRDADNERQRQRGRRTG